MKRLVVKDCVSLRERTSFTVFADESCVEALEIERAECHDLGSCPIDSVLLDIAQSVGYVHFLQTRMAVKIIWKLHRLLGDASELVQVNASGNVRLQAKLAEGHALPFVREGSAPFIFGARGVLKLWLEIQAFLVF